MKRAYPSWLFLLFLTLLATATDEFIIAGVLKSIAADLDVSVSAAGQLVTVFAVVYALGAPTLAVIFERFAKHIVMVVGLSAFVVANIGAALAPDYWTLMAARVVAALAAAVVTSAAFTMTAMGAPEGQQGRYIGVVTAGMTTALFTSVPIGSWLGGSFGWRATFWLIAGVGLVAALGLLVSAPRIAGSTPAPLRTRLGPLRDPAVLRLITVTFLLAGGGLMFYTYLGEFTGELAGGSYGLLSVMLLIVGVAGLVGALVTGRITDSMGPARTLRMVAGGLTVALALAAAVGFAGLGSPVAVGIVVALYAIFAWGFPPPIQGSILRTVGPEVGMTALALNICALYLGTGAAGTIGGAIIGLSDVKWLPVVGAVMVALAFLIAPRRTPEQATGAQADAGREPQEQQAGV
ncbi:MFS transporter [Streptomyces sp. NPDC021093]|uniref:MFS transporter n=1 Tax=Streptomyces sp. NPDC021093 TaxID=3365112 RepID=UPI0037B6DCF9